MPRAIYIVRPDAHGEDCHGVSLGGPVPHPTDWIPCTGREEALRLRDWIQSLECDTCGGALFHEPAPGAWCWTCVKCCAEVRPALTFAPSFYTACGASAKADSYSSGYKAIAEVAGLFSAERAYHVDQERCAERKLSNA